GLDGFQNKYPRELSGGMQQRASLVRCLSFHPSILLMDEPFGALDAFTRDELNLLLQQIWAQTHRTIIFITHNIGEAIFLADRLIVLSARPGRLVREFRIPLPRPRAIDVDRKSTRLNSSHLGISYAVFCLKKKKSHKPTR